MSHGIDHRVSSRRPTVIIEETSRFILPTGYASSYVGFEIGGFELGLDPDITGVNVGNNAVAYWGVGNIDDAYERLLDCGAQARNSVKDVGGDIRVASVADPFGNVIGLIQNPHFRVKE
jgi:predicted enzyme related to lactoylglutathione lyase